MISSQMRKCDSIDVSVDFERCVEIDLSAGETFLNFFDFSLDKFGIGLI